MRYSAQHSYKHRHTQGTAHFREQAEAWLADVLGEEAAALMVERPRG
ncbi:hypothetical protein N9250_02505 [bacterium]|nr:hypothetical protein [bacterium]